MDYNKVITQNNKNRDLLLEIGSSIGGIHDALIDVAGDLDTLNGKYTDSLWFKSDLTETHSYECDALDIVKVMRDYIDEEIDRIESLDKKLD